MTSPTSSQPVLGATQPRKIETQIDGLRHYQERAIEWLVESGRRYLGADRGTGKTVMALRAARQLTKGHVLVLCPKVAIGVWLDEIERWLDFRDETAIAYTSSPAKRRNVRKVIEEDGYSFLIAPYSMAGELATLKPGWSAIILDEAHLLRNRNTNMFKQVARFKSKYLFALSGSPIVKSATDLWTLLYLITEGASDFRGYWPFVMKNFLTVKNRFGMEILGLKNPVAFRNLMQPYVMKLSAKEVLPELPPKIRQVVRLEMTGEQARLYREIAEDAIAEVTKEDGTAALLLVPNAMAKITRIRQVLVTPALIGGEHDSAAFRALEEHLQMDFSSHDSSIVFTPFTQAIPYVVEMLTRIAARPYVVRGGMSAEHIRQTIKEFQGNRDPRKVLVCSLLSGSSFTATQANHAYFLGYDWNPSNNWQAEDRIYRISQTKPCVATYFTYDSTLDERMKGILDGKYLAAKEALSVTPREFLYGER